MFDNLKKRRKIVHEKWLLFIIATVSVFLGISNELMKETNAMLLPVNEYFDDMNFYMCVIDSYNDENMVNYEYTYNLSLEELASIKKLDCSSNNSEVAKYEKIVSTKGLEKMVSLVELSLDEHNITSIYLNENTKLEKVNLKGNLLTNIDVSDNINLLDINVSDNKLSNLDLNNNNKLVNVNSFNNEFCKTLYMYKDNILNLDNIQNLVKLPKVVSNDLFSWLFKSDKISIDNNNVSGYSGGLVNVDGVINYLNDGKLLNYLLINNKINILDIYSDEYLINKDYNFIYSNDMVFDIDKINVVNYSLNVKDDKLQILDKDILVVELDILTTNIGEFDIEDDVINIVDNISYSDFISKVKFNNDKINIKIFNDLNEVNYQDIISGDEIIKIYYNEILLDTYKINGKF